MSDIKELINRIKADIGEMQGNPAHEGARPHFDRTMDLLSEIEFLISLSVPEVEA